jgi:PAS domain S-box-containing protein
VGDGVIATDIHGNVTFLNRVAEELTGWTLTEAVQQPVENIFKIINESTRQVVHQPVRKVLQTGVTSGLANHTLLVRKDGTEIAIDDSGAPIQDADGQTMGVVLVFRDITERRRTEREQAWLASFPQLNPNPILEISLEEQIEFTNRKAQELFPDLLEQGIKHPYLMGWKEITDKILSDPTLVVHREVQVRDRFYQQSIYYDQPYRRIRTYGMDITERKQAEEAVRKYAEELARSNRELEEFAYIASHDLNEPLRKIEMFGSILDRASSRLDMRERDSIQRIVSAAKRMRQMVDGLLTLSRIRTQGQPFIAVDWGMILAEVLSDLEIQLFRTAGHVEAGELPLIQADPLQIRQLLQNLIGNALKYHRAGIPPRVKIICQKTSPNMVQIQIIDNGIGFDESQAERIFQPFQRLVGRSEYEGTGMGLAICRKIVERHNGSIVAHSTAGQGSTFVVTLPIHQPA